MKNDDSYATWERSIERQVETQFRKLKKKRAAQGKPIQADFANVGSLHRKRLLGLFRELSRLADAVNGIGSDVFDHMATSDEKVKHLRPILDSIRESAECAWRIAYHAKPSLFDVEK